MVWSPASSQAAYEAAAAGRSARDIAAEIGCSRSAVVGIVYRHAVRHGLPSVRTAQAVAKRRPEPPKPPRPPAGASRIAVPKKASAYPMTFVRSVPRVIPTCEAVLVDGTPCGRTVLRSCRCMGHLFMAGEVRLRPPARRITSRARLLEEMEAALTRRHPTLNRPIRTAVGNMSAAQVTQAFHGGLVRLARECGWEQLDDDMFVQVRRAA